MDKSRKHDIAQIAEAKKIASPELRQSLDKVEQKIKDQQNDKWLGAARQSLIQEKLKGNEGNVLDIGESIKQRERNKAISSFFISAKTWDGIFNKGKDAR